tara:strand:- start:3973 stop:4830 length:858 start_codon:yes stop_codon:yes gene_type:complete
MKLREITESTVITENPITAQKAAGAVKQAATPPAGEPTSSGAKIDLKKQSKTAQGSKMAANAMGAKGGSGAMMAKGLDKLASGGAMTGALSKQIAPFAKQLTAILGNQQLRQKFMMLVKQAEKAPTEDTAKEGMDLKDKEDYKAKKKALQDIQMDPHTHKDEKLKKELMRKKSDLDSAAKDKGYKEDTEVDAIKQLAGIVSKANTPQTAYSEELKKLAGINEFATAGATSAGNIASVANPAQAKGKRPTDSKGLPKAPQKKKANGTAENALDIKDNFFGGATVKR